MSQLLSQREFPPTSCDRPTCRAWEEEVVADDSGQPMVADRLMDTVQAHAAMAAAAAWAVAALETDFAAAGA